VELADDEDEFDWDSLLLPLPPRSNLTADDDDDDGSRCMFSISSSNGCFCLVPFVECDGCCERPLLVVTIALERLGRVLFVVVVVLQLPMDDEDEMDERLELRFVRFVEFMSKLGGSGFSSTATSIV
jgi:hypothetical protein